ncbi:MAG: histidinol phosphate phosphatase domain-containing protein [Candidatus Omnitrophica bacterium]|nr:histidinol phosphate phosphatase domain-containing protein [Candidatus Omnitrophota bacterium]
MIDFHTHTIFSDGELIPSELVRRAEANGYEAIALTDHVDCSNIDFVLPRIVKAAKQLNKYWKIRVLPGVEISHVPLQEMGRLVRFARKNGAKIIIAHGETTMEPVLPGTNRKAIECGVDIIAHPGHLSEEDARAAAKKGVYIEITTRRTHRATNKEVIRAAKKAGTKLILNTDTHSEADLINDSKARDFLKNLGMTREDIGRIFLNSKELLKKSL